ncbi:MAG: c-type cytochrome [Rhodobacteraceae bacterium]|nr:c-type cytochrome [Alphaproteobacteria bacterium]NNF73043.1 c-type cytochrome [Paracoccaceae bacterium]NNK66783.1 c-type cytochrome [Paracoccaceae bacterium]
MSKFPKLLVSAALVATLATPALAEKLGIGRAAMPEEIAAWDVNVLPDGRGLPEGSMSVLDGEAVFIDNCASCHGDFAEGLDNWPALAGGRGTLRDERPVKTVGSYWPYLSTVWDYVNRSMPFGGAQTLETDEVYGIVAYILYSEGLVDDDFVLSNENFTEVRLPNEDGFYVDDRVEVEFPVFATEPCMENCKDAVEITRKASDLNVTPTDDAGRPLSTIPDVTAGAEAPEEVVVAAVTPEEPPSATEGPDPELVAEGEKLFRQCKSCHELGEGARSRTGPHLNDVFGRVAGTVEGFRYSKPMVAAGEAGLVWTEETVAEFLADPRGYMKGTRMSFRGLKSDDDIAAMNAYLKSATE